MLNWLLLIEFPDVFTEEDYELFLGEVSEGAFIFGISTGAFGMFKVRTEFIRVFVGGEELLPSP